ncbi:YceI family protein [Piscinibacter sakaiensis]|uniref:Putative signal peptide protein n=1 Tax=Piscinibacter sakaiensis TaxID=1547922 RepID=A0A0K8P2U5_PISS1|nr:YceI family protein [Piscinibacter sakaiensis]GAP36495.1 putative signal peptide protein [Piscinibacter sakaiensis]
MLAAALAALHPAAHAQAPAAAAPGAAASSAAAGGPAEYTLDAGHTFVHWEVLHMGTSTIRGRFDKLGGSVRFDARRQQVDVSIAVDTASVSTGLAPFDTIVRGASLLAVQANPQAWFTARRGQWDGEALRSLDGEITLRGTSRPLTLRALRFKCGLNPLFGREVCGGDFEGTLRRSDFGMTLALPLTADEVRVLVQVEGVRAP